MQGHDWPYLLLCASLLAQSDNSSCQDAALRIAQFCLEQPDLDSTHRDAAAVVLDSLANRLAIQLGERRGLLQRGVADRLPFPLFQDWIRRSTENSVTLADSREVSVNHFQRAFWQSAHEHDWVSLSAPTSAGKSYILIRWLVDRLRHSPGATVVYLVPTRALIEEVRRDIEDRLREQAVGSVSVATLPLASSVRSGRANVLVFTQERFHILLAQRGPDLRVDVLIVDEAQKVGDGYRGVLLQQAIDAAVRRNPGCRVVFASAMTGNPELLLDGAPAAASREGIMSGDTMVNQNLVWASQVAGRPMCWDIELVLDGEPTSIGRIELARRPSPGSKRLPYVAFALGSPVGGNIVYANGAADAEKAAKQLYDLLGNGHDQSEDPEIAELVELVERTVHRRYSLAGVLRRGVAFHYGNMPLLIRTEIERLFGLNKVKYLVVRHGDHG